MTKVLDPELRALAHMIRQLEPLGPAERRRVLDYLNSRFGGNHANDTPFPAPHIHTEYGGAGQPGEHKPP